jgi:hypothetical protein
MKSYLLKTLRRFSSNRCTHTTANGRRCRQPVCASDANFCFIHIPKPTPDENLDAQLTAELHAASANLDTPANVLVLLSKIVIAANHNQLELRRARFLIAACNAILRAQRQILQLKKLESQIPDPNYQSDWLSNIPRPIRDDSDFFDIPTALREPLTPEERAAEAARAAELAALANATAAGNAATESSTPTNASTPGAASESSATQLPSNPPATNESLPIAATPIDSHSSAKNFPANEIKTNRTSTHFPKPDSPEEMARNLKANLQVTINRKPKPGEPNPFYFPTATPEPPLSSAENFFAENSPGDPEDSAATLSPQKSTSFTSRLLSKAKSHFQSNRSESTAKSSTKTTANKSPMPEKSPATNPEFFRHFYPFDPTLPPALQAAQDPMNTVPPELRKHARYSDLYHYLSNSKADT